MAWYTPIPQNDPPSKVIYESKIKRFLFKKGKNLLTNELHHIMNQLVTIGIMPQYVQGIADLVMQSYQGHVTIAPNPNFYDY